MKADGKILLLLLFGATLAVAATNNVPQVQHVIIVIQENRTPDNLFNQDTALQTNAHVQPSYKNQVNVAPPCNPGIAGIPLSSTDLFTCWDPDHPHGVTSTSKGAWEKMWDHGQMDGACNISISWNGKSQCGNQGKPACITNGPGSTSTCPLHVRRGAHPD